MTKTLRMAMICSVLVIVGCSGARAPQEEEPEGILGQPHEKPLGGEGEGEDEGEPEPEPEPEGCTDGDFTCDGSILDYCAEGEWERVTCDDLCELDGYTSTGCTGDQCSCDGFADESCFVGADAMCACLDAIGEPCTQDDFLFLYDECWTGDFAVFCYGLYVDDGYVDCQAAAEVCL